MADAPADSIDIIIVDSTDPIGPAEGLFGEAFYRDCVRVLSGNGILVQQSESPLVHQSIISDMYKAMKSAGFNERATLSFPQCIYPTGWWSATMASVATPLNEFRKQAATEKGFETTYYNAEVHQGALAVPEFFKQIAK